jgi:UDP-glucuronate decarboxylase
MRILVTGAAGFLGSHLSHKLLALDHEVIGLDNFYTGRKENITHLLSNDKFEMVRHDVIIPIALEVDIILNLACPASPIHYQRHPVQTLRTSILGISNLLELALKLQCPIFQSSTSEIYGDPSSSPQSESYWGNVNPIGLRACYDEGKRVAETLMFDFHRQYSLDIKIARIFNTYGPRMQIDDGRVVTNFIVQALKNEPITIYGSGSQTRSFCYVDDLIEGLASLIFSDNSTTGPVNFGNPNEFTMLELASYVLQLTGSKSEIVYKDLPQDDPKQRKPDISLAYELFKWEPKIQLVEGLEKTIADLSSRLFINS